MTSKKSRRAKQRVSADEMIFEVWQVITPISPDVDWQAVTPFSMDDEFDGFNHWPVITTTEHMLSEDCAKKFGRGDFVALQLAESRIGYPLAHWVIKVRSPELHDYMPVDPDKQIFNIVRERNNSYLSVTDGGFYRRCEVKVASLCLKELDEPKAKESRESPQVRRAKELIAKGKSMPEVVESLISEANIYWP